VSSYGRLIIALLSTSIAAGVAAQTSAPPLAMPKTADSQPAAGTTSYRSVFDGYVATSEDKPVSWREANGLVGSIGGWRVYAREAQQPTPANTAPAARTGSPAPANAAPPPAAGSTPHQKH